MVIEWLKFRVSPQSREKFIQKDEEIWTATLAKYPGFLGKEVWINPSAPEEIVLVARWQTREEWKAIPQKDLDETERQFAQAMGEGRYQMIETGEYQVRKFPAS
ncbi:MAG: TIGR03792 family protein [Hydrococcus sp. C42_A2020_068]|nr:TIGR03792 family protein [Hydrococcus sp. C42_A2020_068]